MSKPTKAYEGTTVSAEKSMAETMALLRRRDCLGIQWTEECATTVLRFRWRAASGAEMCARFTMQARPTTRPGQTPKQRAEALDRERRRLFRVLVHFLKNLFEAVDGGLLTTEQAFLPFLEDASGRTIGELIVPHLAKLASSPLALALAPPEGQR